MLVHEPYDIRKDPTALDIYYRWTVRKPRIVLWAEGLWHCYGDGSCGRGDSPMRAYADWFYEHTKETLRRQRWPA